MLRELPSSICCLSAITTRLLRDVRVRLSGLYKVLQWSQFYLDRAKEVLNRHYSPCLPCQWNCCFLASQFPITLLLRDSVTCQRSVVQAGTEPGSVCQSRVLSPQQFLLRSRLSFTVPCGVSDHVSCRVLSIFSELVSKTFKLRMIVFTVVTRFFPPVSISA